MIYLKIPSRNLPGETEESSRITLFEIISSPLRDSERIQEGYKQKHHFYINLLGSILFMYEFIHSAGRLIYYGSEDT